MWLKCRGPGLYSLFRVRRQWPACVVELQIVANSDLDLFEKKRKKIRSVVSLWQMAPRM